VGRGSFKKAARLLAGLDIGSDAVIVTNKRIFNLYGKILVSLSGIKNLSYGEELILRGNLYRPPRQNNVGRRSYRDYLSSQGIYLLLNIKSALDVVRLNRHCGFWLRGFSLRPVIYSFMRILAASAAMGFVCWILTGSNFSAPFLSNKFAKLGAGLFLGVVSYAGFCFIFRVPELGEFLRWVSKRRRCDWKS